MEHFRTQGYQYVDEDMCMVLDIVTGKPAIELTKDAIIKVSDAIRIFNKELPLYISRERLVIIKMATITAHKL